MPAAILAVAIVGLACVVGLFWIAFDEELDRIYPPKGPRHEP